MTTATVENTLTTRFGIKSLYPLQERIIERVMAGGDALVVMPTGSGKSLCFQLPALALEPRGTALVFSPLIALMEDQVAALGRRAIRAGYINSSLSKSKRNERYKSLAQGAYELIYVTPERMLKPDFVEAIANIPGGVHLLAVDEAHCISKWGHDLRPSYQQIGAFRNQIAQRSGVNPVTIALTATATKAVREDIRSVLGLTDEQMPLFAQPVDRPNLSYTSAEIWSESARLDRIVEAVQARPGSGIVYFSLIKDIERIEPALAERLPEYTIQIYNGRLHPGEKKAVYQRFIDAGPDDRLVLLATNAFGMGVDKPDLRYIVHAQLPASMEAWHQETGRAGRDNLPSTCLMILAQEDIAIQAQFIEWMNPPANLLVQVAQAFERSDHADHDIEELNLVVFGKNRGAWGSRMEYALITLEKLGVVSQTGVNGRWTMTGELDDSMIDPAEIELKKKRDLARLLDVVRLARAPDMRSVIRDYFELE